MQLHTRASIVAGTSLLGAALFAWHPAAARRPGEPPRTTSALEAAIAGIEAGRRTTPLVGEPAANGEATVTFLARRDGGRVPRIVSDVTGWGEHVDGTFDFAAGTMTRVGRTDWYSLQAKVMPRARIEYLVAYGMTDYRPDPHNPRRAARADPVSEFVTPGYVAPAELADPPPAPAGTLAETDIESRVRGTSRLIVYTPAGYREDGNYPVAVFLDARADRVSRVIDWAILHETIEPIVAVFLDPHPPGDTDHAGRALRTFVSDELPAWLASRYAVAKGPGRRAILGISFGAKDALDAALGLAAAFDRVGLLVPGRRIGRADINAMANRRGRRVRVAILAGRYDRANVATARGVRDALRTAGHAVDYVEVPEGHSPVTWLNHLGAVLASLFHPPSPPDQHRPHDSHVRRPTDGKYARDAVGAGTARSRASFGPTGGSQPPGTRRRAAITGAPILRSRGTSRTAASIPPSARTAGRRPTSSATTTTGPGDRLE